MSRTLTWIPRNGAALALSGNSGVYASRGVQIVGMPSVRYSEILVPLQPGARWQQVDHGTRDVVVPLRITGDIGAEMDRLAAAINPTNGDGRLRQTRDDGTERDLYCRYVDGLTLEEQFYGQRVWSGALIFHAVDPYWYDTTDQSVVVQPEQGAAFFPIFPITLNASEATNEATVVNDGHVQVWPVWTITGPGVVSAENESLGESWSLDHELGAGEIVTVDTRPGVKTVVSSAAGDLFGAFSGPMWPLGVGVNRVRLEISGASAESVFVLSWRRGWLTA